jgi:DHA2 family lincomycin resistance protein-like MFS transporter
MMVQAIIIAVYAFLSRRFTTRRLFFTAAVLFAVGQLGCLIAPVFSVLLAFRLLQACGGGMLIPMMMGAVLALAPREKLGTYLALGTGSITIGPAVAPIICGAAATLLGWHAVFATPLFFIVLIALLGSKAIKPLGEVQKIRIDVASVVLIAVVLSAFVFGMGRITGETVVGLVALAVSVVAGFAFVRRQNRLAQPFLSVKPLRNPVFAVACILLILSIMQNFSMSLLVPLYFVNVFSSTALTAGLLLIPPILVMTGITLVSGRIMDKFGAWPLFPLGFLVLLVGQILVAVFGLQQSIVGVVAASVLVYGGAGLVQTPIQTAALKTLSPQESAGGISLLNVFIQSASAIGPALFVGILSSTFAAAVSSGAVAADAQAQGFATAVGVAAIIATVGIAIAIPLARKTRK